MLFRLEIHTRTIDFGERWDQEVNMVQHVLREAIARIGSGHGPIPITDRSGRPVATYVFGSGMLNESTK